jgi:hypothetical protein
MGPPVSPTNKIYLNNITKILLIVALNTINHKLLKLDAERTRKYHFVV